MSQPVISSPCCCAISSSVWRFAARRLDMYEQPTWLHELWIAREALWSGFMTSVQCAGLAIVLGTVIGVFAGLNLTYGKLWARLPFRCYVDLIRGTPVFVLVLACFYMAPAMGWQISAFQAGAL